MPEATPAPMSVGGLKAAVAPALREILRAEELAAASVRVLHSAAPLSAMDDGEALGPDTQLQVFVLGESCLAWVDGSESAEEVRARIRSDLQDFVAESTFGWGQQRP